MLLVLHVYTLKGPIGRVSRYGSNAPSSWRPDTDQNTCHFRSAQNLGSLHPVLKDLNIVLCEAPVQNPGPVAYDKGNVHQTDIHFYRQPGRFLGQSHASQNKTNESESHDREIRPVVTRSLHEFAQSLAARYSYLTGRLGVAVSGGADSVLLLHALHQAGLAGHILHVNHLLRGAESDADAAFVAQLAESLGLPHTSATLPPAEGNLEQEARRSRYSFFSQCIADGICVAVATGHTLDDQAETVLSRFLRGAGTAGLAAILPETASGIIRPLLEVPRADIRNWLAERNLSWREDSSNADTTFLRNRLRHEVIPVLTAINPSLANTLAGTAEWARAEEAYWTAELERLTPTHLRHEGETVLLKTATLLQLPLATQRRLLRRALDLVRGDLRSIDFQHIEAVRNLCLSREGSGRLQLPGVDIYRSFDWLRIFPLGFDNRLDRDFEVPLPLPGRTEIPERHLTVEMELVGANHVYNSDLDALDPAHFTGPLVLRNWRPGDTLHVRGAAHAEKIKTLFQDYRVPLWERRAWPVIAYGRSVVWTRRFGVAAEYAAGNAVSPVLVVREVITGRSRID